MAKGRRKFKEKTDVAPEIKDYAVADKKVGVPDMGNIKPPSESSKVCKSCNDIQALHYGGAKNWCNKPGCNCQEFK